MRDAMPMVGDAMPMVGDAMPIVGDAMPMVGDAMPMVGMGTKKPALGRALGVCGDGSEAAATPRRWAADAAQPVGLQFPIEWFGVGQPR